MASKSGVILQVSFERRRKEGWFSKPFKAGLLYTSLSSSNEKNQKKTKKTKKNHSYTKEKKNEEDEEEEEEQQQEDGPILLPLVFP